MVVKYLRVALLDLDDEKDMNRVFRRRYTNKSTILTSKHSD